MSHVEALKSVTLFELAKMRAERTKIVMLTAYDASFATLCGRAGVDVILVGDSLGNVVQGQRSTLSVSIDHMVYHTECVARAGGRSLVLADMPFGSYHESREQALRNAARLMAVGAQMVKLEGGAYVADTAAFLVERGIPVCGHIGFTPQAVHQLGGYRVQGRGDARAEQLKRDALALQQAGAALLVMEMIPSALAGEVTASLESTATIGIGAGPDCDGQILVLYDMLGIFPGKSARFVRDFMQGAAGVEDAIARYVEAVRNGSFPGPEHCYQ